jgi:purine-nucleoside phosphorylase
MSVSDSLVTKVETTSKERQTGFTQMMEVALEIALEA